MSFCRIFALFCVPSDLNSLTVEIKLAISCCLFRGLFRAFGHIRDLFRISHKRFFVHCIWKNQVKRRFIIKRAIAICEHLKVSNIKKISKSVVAKGSLRDTFSEKERNLRESQSRRKVGVRMLESPHHHLKFSKTRHVGDSFKSSWDYIGLFRTLWRFWSFFKMLIHENTLLEWIPY